MDDLALRIASKHGQPALVEILSRGLSGSELHTVLLAATKERIQSQSNTDLTNASKVTKVCNLDGRLLHQVEGLAYQNASKYTVTELSPLNPLGTTNRLSGLHQGNILSTIRAYEVASDPTVGLALECARLRKEQNQRKTNTRLCTSQRVVRFPEPTNSSYTAHFKLFSLIDSSRDTGGFAFELAALKSQITVYLRLLETLKQSGFTHHSIAVEISDTRIVKLLCQHHGIDLNKIKSQVRASDSESATRLLAQYNNLWNKAPQNVLNDLSTYGLPTHLTTQLDMIQNHVLVVLREIFPDVSLSLNLHRLTGLNYYQGPALHIKVKDNNNHDYMVADGGFVDWTQKLLTDNKERLLTSAIGTELLCRVFYV